MPTNKMLVDAYEALDRCCRAASDSRDAYPTFVDLRSSLGDFIRENRPGLAESLQIQEGD